jgi:hypothetical protein
MLLAPLALISMGLLSLAPSGIPAGDPPKKPSDLPAEITVEAGTSRAWALMTCSVPFARDNFRHELLAGATSNQNNVKALRQMLELKYGVKRRIDLVNVLDQHVAASWKAATFPR